MIEVRPNTPRVQDTAPGGAVVARYSVRMSDNSPFTGTVRFGPPYYDNNGRFALAGSNIIVNPDGPGIGPNKATMTDHITLEAIPGETQRSDADRLESVRLPPQQQAVQQHRRDADANRAVGEIEGRPMRGSEVKIQKVDDGAEA